MAHSRAADPLEQALSAAIARTIDDGRYAALYRRWFGEDPGTAQHPLPPIGGVTSPAVSEAGGSVLETVLQRGSLRVGYALMGPPFSFEAQDVTEDVTVTGWDLELGQLLTAALSEAYGQPITAEAVQLPAAPFPARLFDELDAGTVDIILSDLAVTEEREKRVDFTTPYLMVTFGLLCGPDFQPQTLADVDRGDVTVVVLRHAFLNELADRHLPNAARQFVPDPLDMVPQLLNGSADAVLLPIASIQAYLELAQAEDRALHRANFTIGPQATRAIALRQR